MTRIQPWTEPALMQREQVFEALTTKAIKQTVRKVSAQLLAGTLTAAAEPAAVATTATIDYAALEGAVMATWNGYVSNELYPFLINTFVTSATAVVDGVAEASGEVVDTLTNTFASEFLQYAHNRMVNIGEQIWVNIREQLSEGFEAGESIPQIASRLTQVAGLTTPRALTTARTEIISAANAGSYLQMIDAGFEEKVTKVWLATEGTSTRESHRHADNQGVLLTDEFSVDIYSGDIKTGTEGLEFPGDPTGTPGNIINCRCSLAFDFEDEDEDGGVLNAAGFVEKKHPRDKDGKFKKKGAPDLYIKIPDLADKPSNSSPAVEKVAWMAEHKWGSMTPGQKGVLIKNISEDDWQKLPPSLKEKIKDAPSTTSNPEAKHLLEQDVAKLDAFQDDAPSASEGRPLGGVDAKTGKELTPGKPTKLRVQLLYNTKFEDGAIMAVRKDSDERIIWDENAKKIKRQKLVDGTYQTTEALSRGNAYAKWKDEDGWSIPDAATLPQPAGDNGKSVPVAAPSVGKPVAIKVQLVYQTPFNDGDTVAVKTSTGEKITWDAGKKRMIVHAADGSTKEYTRGALYKEFKDETGWHLPGAPGDEPDDSLDTDVTPAVAPYSPPSSLGGEGTDKVLNALGNPDVPNGTTLFESKGLGMTTTITKLDDGVGEVEHSPYTGASGKAKFFAEDANTEHILKAIGQAKKNALDTEKAKVEVGQDVDDEENGLPGGSEDVLPAQSTSTFQTVQKIGSADEWQTALDSMVEALNDPSVPAGTVLFSVLAMSITKNDDGVATLKTDKGEKIIYDGDLTPDGFINNVLSINDSFKSVPSVSSPGDVTDDDIEGVKDDFETSFVGDVLWENDTVSVDKANDSQVSINMKDDLGSFTTVEIDDLTAAHVNDFVETNTPDSAIVPGSSSDNLATSLKNAVENPNFPPLEQIAEGDGYHVLKISDKGVQVVNTDTYQSKIIKKDDLTGATLDAALAEIGVSEAPAPAPKLTAAQAGVIKNAASNPLVPAVSTLYEDDDFEILKGNGVIGVWSKSDQMVSSETIDIDDISPESIQNAFDEINASLGKASQFTANVNTPTAKAATPNVSVTGKTMTTSLVGSKPLKMSASVLTGPKSTKYTDGQIVGYHPETTAGLGDELLVWNGKTKKYDVYTRPAGSQDDWQKSFTYNKQAALKELSGDEGWLTPPADLQSPAGSAVPSVNGGGSVPSFSTPEPSSGLVPKFTTVQLSAAADSKIAALSDDQVKSIYTNFRQKNKNNSYDVVRLTSSGEEVLEAVLRAQVAHKKATGEHLNMLEIIKAVDIQAAKDVNAANGNLFEKKLVDWLGTPDGKKKAPLVLHEFRLTPAEKAKLEADKQAAKKAELDAKLKDFHAITAGLSKPSTTSTEFPVQTTTSANEAQNAALAKTPWTAAQKTALKKYTGSYYHTLNNMLRGKLEPTDQSLKDAKDAQKGMRPLEKDMLLYRGTGAVPGLLPADLDSWNQLIGSTFQEPGFSSTSINNPFGGQIKLEIEAPKGTPAAYVKSISNHAGENEVLLAAGTKFQVLSAKQTGGYTIVVRVRVVP